jgi:hypothetical protein
MRSTRRALASCALAVLLAVAAMPAAAAELSDGVEAHLVLHGLFTKRNNALQQAVLLEPRSSAFRPASPVFLLGDYLRPALHQSYFSGLLSAGLEGRGLGGRLRWVITADTGEVRRESLPAGEAVCRSGGTLDAGNLLTPTPTGLALPGSGRCNLVRRVRIVDGTTLASPIWTSNGRSFEDEAKSTLLLREAYLGLSFGRADFAVVRAGRKRITVGDGYVFDGWATGVETDLDLGAIGPSWDVGAAVFYPTPDIPTGNQLASPLISLRADYLPSLFEHAGLFAAAFWDQDGSTGALFRGSAVEELVTRLQGLSPGTDPYRNGSQLLAGVLDAPFPSTGFLSWLGTSGDLRLLGGRLRWTGAVVLGQLTLRPEESPITGSVFGQLAALRFEREPLPGLTLGGFFLYLSGDLPPVQRKRRGLSPDYGGFLGVNPFLTETNLFFEGGTSESFSNRQASAPGINGRGVIAPGLTVAWDPIDLLRAQARGAYLVAPRVGPYGGLVYGPELDVNLTVTPTPWLTFTGETDVLWPGDFFGQGGPMVKVVFGVELRPL